MTSSWWAGPVRGRGLSRSMTGLIGCISPPLPNTGQQHKLK